MTLFEDLILPTSKEIVNEILFRETSLFSGERNIPMITATFFSKLLYLCQSIGIKYSS